MALIFGARFAKMCMHWLPGDLHIELSAAGRLTCLFEGKGVMCEPI